VSPGAAREPAPEDNNTMVWLGIPLGIGLVVLGVCLWIFPKPPRIDFAFYQRYEPRALVALLCLILGVVALLVGILQS
jgi:hypothetical protein